MSSTVKQSYKKHLTPKFRTERIGKERLQFEIQVIGFPPTGVEIYSFTRIATNGTDVARSEAYTYTYRRSFDDNSPVRDLVDNGFTGYFYQRQQLGSTGRLLGADGRDRYWLVRTLSNNTASSESTRLDGTCILERFFRSLLYTIRPLRFISSKDNTATTPLPMNRFLFDEDVIELMHSYLERDQISPTFAACYPTIADVFFRENYPREAELQFGYGRYDENADVNKETSN